MEQRRQSGTAVGPRNGPVRGDRLGSRAGSSVHGPRDDHDVAGQTGTADPAREGRGAGPCRRRAIAGRCSDGPDPGALPGDRRPADGRIVLLGVLHQRSQGKPVDALHACRPRVHSRGRRRRSGGDDGAGPDCPGSRSSSACWPVPSRTPCFRMLQGRRKSRRHPRAPVRKRQAGSPCRRR